MSSSSVEKYFLIKRNEETGARISGLCRQKLCNKRITSADTGNYFKHVKRAHFELYKIYCKAKNNNNNYDNNNNNNNDNTIDHADNCTDLAITAKSPNKRQRLSDSTQKTIGFPVISETKLTNFKKKTAKTWAKLGLSHRLIENTDVRRLFSEFGKLECQESARFSSRKEIRANILSAGKEIFDKIIRKLQTDANFVTLALDGWTPHAHGAKNTNIIALSGGKSYLLWSDRNSDEKDTTEGYLLPLLQEKIEYLLSKQIAVVAFTSDNAENMLKLGREMYKLPKTGPIILHICCSAHTIELILTDIISLEPLNSLITHCLAIIGDFTGKNGKDYRLQLRNFQKNATNSSLKLVLFNKTRWLSRFHAIKRLIQLKQAIQFIFHRNSLPNSIDIQSDLYWNKQENVVLRLLSAFATAVNLVQSDRANLSTLNEAISGIRAAINNCAIVEHKAGTETSEILFKTAANELLNRRICDSVLQKGCHYAFWAVSLLTDTDLLQWQSTFGDSRRDLSETMSWIANWGADLLLFYANQVEIKQYNDVTTLVEEIVSQIHRFRGRLGCFADKNSKKLTLTEEIPRNSFEFDENNPKKRRTDWVLYWTSMKDEAPELSCIAICLLSIGISEAACERSFSLQKLTHSALRNRLEASVVEAEMRLRYNEDDAEKKVEKEEEEGEEELSDSDY
jgi:hypothetical protein